MVKDKCSMYDILTIKQANEEEGNSVQICEVVHMCSADGRTTHELIFQK